MFGQIVLYLLSRITVAFAKLAVKEGYIRQPNFEVWPWFAAFVWGSVLWLFEFHRCDDRRRYKLYNIVSIPKRPIFHFFITGGLCRIV